MVTVTVELLDAARYAQEDQEEWRLLVAELQKPACPAGNKLYDHGAGSRARIVPSYRAQVSWLPPINLRRGN
jgi:hypothetical protein